MLSYLLLGTLLVLGLGPIVSEMRAGSFDFFNAKNPFIVYYVIQLGVSGWVTLATGIPSDIGLDPVRFHIYYDLAFAVAAAGMAAFQFGYYTQRPAVIALPVVARASWQPGRYQKIAFLYCVTGACAFMLLLRANGGLVNFLQQREAFRAGGVVGQGMLLFASTGLITIGAEVYFLGSIFRAERRRRHVAGALILFGAGLIPPFLIGFRALVGLPILQLLVCWHYGYRPIPTRKIILTLFFLATGFTVYGVSRAIPAGLPLTDAIPVARTVVTQNPELLYTVISRSKGTEVLAAVIARLHTTGKYDLGWRAVLETGTIIVPHAIWPDKPQPVSERFSTSMFGDALSYSRHEVRDAWGGVSPTAAGELYWHFGVIGVVIGLFLLGRFGRIIYISVRHYIDRPSVLLGYAILYTSFTMFAETFQGYVNGLVLYAIVLYSTLFALTARPRLRGPLVGTSSPAASLPSTSSSN